MTVPLSPQDAAAQLSAVAADLAAALANEESAPLAPVMLLDRACDLIDRLSWAMCREPAVVPVGGLAEIARALAAVLRADSEEALSDDEALDLHARVIEAQASDLIAAYRLWAARGRRAGTFRDLLEGELADLPLAAAVFAELADIDIDKAIGRQVALTRSPAPGTQAPETPGEAALAPAGVETRPEWLS
jgi:hypothetical protein